MCPRDNIRKTPTVMHNTVFEHSNTLSFALLACIILHIKSTQFRCSVITFVQYISQLIRFARVCSSVDDFNNRNIFVTAKLLKQGYRYKEIRKAFSKVYHRNSELIVKYNIGLKTLLQQGISELIFHGDLVYKFKRIVWKTLF